MAAFLAALALVAQSIGAGSIAPATPPASTDFLTHYHFKPSEVMVTLRAYHDAVQLYRNGAAERAIAAVRQLPPQQLEFVIETLRDRGRVAATRPEHPEYLPFDWTRDDLAAAGMLQGDIAIAAAGTNRFDAQLRLALSVLRIADAAPPDTSESERFWTRDWLRSVGDLLLAHGDGWEDLGILLNYVEILFPDDGPLLLVRGAMMELASGFAAPRAALTYTGGFNSARRDRDQRQEAAVEALTRAVRTMPESSEAAVRLAHVYVETGHDDRAIPLLDRVLASTDDRWWYLAALLRAGIDERAGQIAAAERLYTATIDRFPNAQSPYLALALLQDAHGRRDESLATLDRMYTRPQTPDADPWWLYPVTMWTDADAALLRLRAAVRR